MKKLNLYIAAIGILSLTSCSNSFLDLTDETTITSETFFKTTDHFEQALVASYTGMRNIALDGIFMDEMRSDNTFFTRYSGDRGPYNSTEKIALFFDDETVSWAPDRYNNVYACIARVNTILNRLDGSELTEDEKQTVRAEALFLRAFYYFDLVTHWGGVPLMLEEVTSEAEAFKAKEKKIEESLSQEATEYIEMECPHCGQIIRMKK